MGHPSIENRTPFAFQDLYLTDEEARPLLVPVVKATYSFEVRGTLALAEEQVPLRPAGQSYGKPGESSYKYEPECAFIKLATDVVLIGHAHAQEKSTKELLVALKVGPVQKSVRVVGDRVWVKSLGSVVMSNPVPFERVPLRYERTFGGWDRMDPNPDKHRYEPRNPVGVSFRASARHFEEGLRLPNLEDPARPLQHFGQVVPPACFGFTAPHWQPRAAFGGTYDEAWTKTRMPLLPKDFDRRFFSAASPGLIAPGYLCGNEPVVIANATPESRVSFNLPGVPPPQIQVEWSDQPDVQVETHLDTVILDTDERKLFLLWRGHLPLHDGPHDVRSIAVSAEGVEAPPTQDS